MVVVDGAHHRWDPSRLGKRSPYFQVYADMHDSHVTPLHETRQSARNRLDRGATNVLKALAVNARSLKVEIGPTPSTKGWDPKDNPVAVQLWPRTKLG